MEDITAFVKKKTTININNVDRTFTELSLGDFADFNVWVTKKHEEQNEKRRAMMLTYADRLKDLNSAELLKMLVAPMTEAEVDAKMYTTEGIGYLAWLSMRYQHTNFTLDDVMKMLTLESVDAITAAMFPKSKADEVKKKLMAKAETESASSPQSL